MTDYVLTGVKWGAPEFGTPVGQITWSFAQSPGDFADFDQYITSPEYQTLVREAFDAWEQVAAIDFVEVPDSRDVDIRLAWSALDGAFGTVGLTGTTEYASTSPGTLGKITEAEVMFDLAENWQTDKVQSPGQPTFYITALHEIGHAIGLDHTPSPDTIMYTFQPTVVELTAGDIAGVRALYGAFLVTEGADNIIGTSQVDEIFALAGNDIITGGGDNDIVNGGAGIDTAVYSGAQSSHTLTLSATAITITDRRADGDGTDTLIDIETLNFNESSFDLAQFGGTAGLSAEAFKSFIELYIAYFNRAPDAIGLNFWGTAFAEGTTLEETATLFIDQEETLAVYPTGTSNNIFAETVYNNVLGRTPDQAGFDFWVGQLDSGNVSRDQFILEVLRGVQPETPDRSYLDTKVDLGAYFAVHKGMSDTGNAAAALALFDGTDTGTDAAIAAIDGYHADAQDPTNGEFLMPLVGVLDDPFAGV